ncbi:MAG: aldehyde dehydrogenase family protein, partial [Gammaproteobacteria bacterium]
LKIGPALAAGNAVLLKPSELSPSSALLLGRLALEAGLPPGVLSVLPGAAVTGDALARSPGVDMLSFTGSTATGRALLRASGESSLKPLLLECGGKSPEILFDDLDGPALDAVVGQIAGGVLWNQGQVCVTRSRLLVHESIHDRVLERVLAIMGSVKAGHPRDPGTQFGPLASPAQAERVRRWIDTGEREGARLRLDGRGAGGCRVEPTVFTDVAPGSAIAREEIFGPVLCVFPFRDESEAVALANTSDYGLAATVWTRELARGHRVSAALRAGKVRVCAGPVPPVPAAGFAHSAEPAGQSGYGIEGGMRGLESYTRQQAVEIAWPPLN